MYSIVEIKGKQYRVEAGATVRVDHLDLEKDAVVPDIRRKTAEEFIIWLD